MKASMRSTAEAATGRRSADRPPRRGGPASRFGATAAVAIALIGITAGVAGEAHADDWPTRPLRLVIGFAPGGSNDIVGRAVAMELGERLKQQVVIENRPGAGGIIAADIVAQAPPDGYSLLLISSSFTMNQSIVKLPYDPIKSFEPVALLGSGPSAVAVPASLPVRTVAELIAYAKSRPGQTNITSTGIGSFQHFAAELFKMRTGTDMAVIQYKGGAPALADLAAGTVQVGIGSMNQTLPFIKSGKIRVIGIAGKKRSPLMPDVPTVSESGVPGYEAVNWWGVLAPAGTPAAILERINRETNATLSSEAITKRFAQEAAEPAAMTRSEFAAFMREEADRWADVAAKAGIKAK